MGGLGGPPTALPAVTHDTTLILGPTHGLDRPISASCRSGRLGLPTGEFVGRTYLWLNIGLLTVNVYLQATPESPLPMGVSDPLTIITIREGEVRFKLTDVLLSAVKDRFASDRPEVMALEGALLIRRHPAVIETFSNGNFQVRAHLFQPLKESPHATA